MLGKLSRSNACCKSTNVNGFLIRIDDCLASNYILRVTAEDVA